MIHYVTEAVLVWLIFVGLFVCLMISFRSWHVVSTLGFGARFETWGSRQPCLSLSSTSTLLSSLWLSCGQEAGSLRYPVVSYTTFLEKVMRMWLIVVNVVKAIQDSDERMRAKHIISNTKWGLINIIPVEMLCYFKHYRLLKGLKFSIILAQLLNVEMKSSGLDSVSFVSHLPNG